MQEEARNRLHVASQASTPAWHGAVPAGAAAQRESPCGGGGSPRAPVGEGAAEALEAAEVEAEAAAVGLLPPRPGGGAESSAGKGRSQPSPEPGSWGWTALGLGWGLVGGGVVVGGRLEWLRAGVCVWCEACVSCEACGVAWQRIAWDSVGASSSEGARRGLAGVCDVGRSAWSSGSRRRPASGLALAQRFVGPFVPS